MPPLLELAQFGNPSPGLRPEALIFRPFGAVARLSHSVRVALQSRVALQPVETGLAPSRLPRELYCDVARCHYRRLLLWDSVFLISGAASVQKRWPVR